MTIEKAPIIRSELVLALPIFPASHPASIVGADELNFCVRDGNRWTLIAINTNSNKIRWEILFLKTRFQFNRRFSMTLTPTVRATETGHLASGHTLKTEQE